VKTPEGLAREWYSQMLKSGRDPLGDEGFLAGYEAGYTAGREASHKIFEATKERLIRMMFPEFHHGPLLLKHTKEDK
jgi:hypothetical protein